MRLDMDRGLTVIGETDTKIAETLRNLEKQCL